MSTTIKEIAKMANVSRGTVDKVLNNRPGVKKETSDRVKRIIEELNYQPNIIGKALVQKNHPYKLEIILTPDYNPYIKETIKGIQQGITEFSPFGLEITTKILTSLDPAEQLQILEEFEQNSFSGLAIFPLDDSRILDRIDQMTRKGIPIITFNSSIPDLHPICHIGQDHYRGGRIAAGLLSKQIPADGKIGIIISSDTLSCHPDRLKGFQDKLKESAPGISIVEVAENQDRKEEAYRLTMDYCKRHPDLKGIYISGGGVGGVGEALEDLKKAAQVNVVCHDITPDSKEMLKKGTIDFVISQSSTVQGYQIVKTFFEYFFKKEMPKSNFIDMPFQILTDELLY